MSFHAYAHLTDKYILLPHGASMGDNYGPVVVAREDESAGSAGARQDESRRSAAGAKAESLDGVTVAIPGTLTTAFLALRLYKPDVQYVVMPFDEILEAVRDGKADAGLLIHEGQLTYAGAGLHKVIDLGEWWKNEHNLPLPLGGNAIRRFDPETETFETFELPHDPDALIELSRERLAASDLEVAHAAASRLDAVAPGTVEAHRALGAVALAEHDYDQAREHYRKILELEPLDQEAHERLAMIGEQRPRGRMRRLMGWR